MKLNLKINNYPFWIFLAIAVKGLFFWSQVYSYYHETAPLIGHYTHDSGEYYGGMNHFYEHGTYKPDIRMPGLGVIYLLFRLFFENNTVLNIILILQWLASGLAIFTLALMISRIVKRESAFYFVFFLFLFTHYVYFWNNWLLSESFAMTFFIFAIHFLNRFLVLDQKKYLFWAGFFFTWCVFIRPVFLLFYGLSAIFLLIYFIREKRGFKQIFTHAVAFFLLFCILDSAWIIRNWKVKNKFEYLNDIDWYSKLSPHSPDPALYFFLESWGGDLENERNWFEIDYEIDYRYRDTIIPDRIYTSQFNRDSLVLVKKRIQWYKVHPSDSIVAYINNSLMAFTASIKDEQPFTFYIGSGLIFMKRQIFSGYFPYNAFDENFQRLPLYKKIGKLSIAVLFFILFFTGLLYSFYVLLRNNKSYILFLLIICAYANLIYIAFFFKTPEFRYVLPSAIVFFCLTAILANKLWCRFKSRSSSVKQ